MPPAFPEAYAFESPLKIPAMLAALNSAGPWTWTQRDSDTYGDYLRARPDGGPTKLRIIVDGDAYLLDAFYLNGSPENRLSRAEVEQVILDKVLPAVQASKVRPTQGL
jgi:hypothetical protein